MLDEADEMLSRGFKDQIYDVFKNLPAEVQVSAHLNPIFHKPSILFTLILGYPAFRHDAG